MRAKRGFTLIEMVVVIAVMGILFTILIGITRALVTQQRYATTRARMANVDTALAVFVSTNKRLPCPADGRNPSSAANAGIEAQSGTPRTCTNNQQYGVVPWTALGLTASDVEDGWGGRFTYRVGPELVVNSAMDFTACDPAGSAALPGTTPPYCNTACSSTALASCTPPATALTGSVGKGLVVENIAGTILTDPRASPSTGAAYMVISHGPEGGGAYDANGGLRSSTVAAGTAEAMNYANIAWSNPPNPGTPTVFLVDDVVNATTTTSHFDDIVSRVGILALAMKAQTGPRSH
jgi:prepilin-type N-terminal cleavage/methylation domain-containing protein